MYRYTPPKSSIWGHALRKMRPAQQRDLFSAFLKSAVSELSYRNGCLSFSIGEAADSDLKRFEGLLATPAVNGGFWSLTATQVEAALAEMLRDEDMARRVSLLQSVHIISWLINGTVIPTKSSFNLYYGSQPCISTFLAFDTIDQYQFVKAALADSGLCTLNDKHLKPVRRPIA